MNCRERFNCVMNFEKPDRLPLWDFGYWPETLDRLYGEGLSREADLVDYFGLDRITFAPINFNFVPAFEPTVLDEDDLTQTIRDETGCTKKVFKYGSAMPHFIDFPIRSRKDFLELKERLDPNSPERYPHNWASLVESYKNRDYILGFVCRGLLAFGRDFMHFNDLMTAFMDEPEWVEEMMDFHTEFMMRLWDRALSEVDVDFIQLGEDMAYKTGPMISPRLVREMMVPRYKRLIGFLKDRGVKHILVDSDGDIRQLIPLFIEGGVTGVWPLECNAGCDVVELRSEYPRLQMIGGLDKQTIALGGEAMEKEVRRKVQTVGPTGGYIPGFDHSVHPDVSLDTYISYLDLLREIGGQLS
ncbi:MAG: uroporphyrinogen decarboxylase family protein [Armatimonadota bacterium]